MHKYFDENQILGINGDGVCTMIRGRANGYIYDNQYISLSMIATLFIFATSNEVYNPRMCDLHCPTAVLTKINDYL